MKKQIAVLLVLGLATHSFAATLSRLHSGDIQNGKPVNASHLNNEFNQLVNESNSKETRITNLESGSVTISGNKTFSGTNSHSGANTFSSTVSFTGIPTFSNNVNVTGDLNLARSSDPTVSNGDIWYNSTGNQLKARINGSTVVLGAAIPVGYIAGNKPVYATANTITLASGMSVTDDANSVTITTTTTETCSLATSGAGGLDTGSEASNTWYYPWLIRNSSSGAVDCLFSTSRTSPTMPSGYDQKRRLPLAVRNDASSAIIPFMVGQGWPDSPFIEYNVHIGDHTSVGSNNVLNAGTATSFTAVDLSSLVPPISTMAYLRGIHLYSSTGGQFRIRATGESHNGFAITTPNSSTTARPDAVWHQITNSSQSVDYMNSGTSTQNWLWVMGYTVNE